MAEFFNTYGFLIVSAVFGAILGISVYLPLMAGQLSLATPGFYALGGYIAAIASTKILTTTTGSVPVWWVLLEMLAGGVISGLLAVVLGIPVLRLRGIYLAIATIAFVEILRVVALNLDITGGAVGIFGIPQPFQSPLEYLWIALPLLGLSMAFMYRLEKIRVGRALIAIREDELAADSMGINPTYYKVLAFVLAAILAGMVGAVSAHFLNTWNARQGTFDASIIFLAFVLIGGSRTFWGPVVGGILLTALPEVLRGLSSVNGVPLWLGQFLKDGRLIIFGILIVVGTIFYPKGIITPEFLKWCSQTTQKAFAKTK
ncbi:MULTISPECIES: branched-chain amino acid ABC transporter permease [Pseudanabaena]|uniref:branched-chain amino acid ABC transporter permease n=1 Tax=Pseudanabaena TaxID=1152 RepID=UPI00247AB116|nr:MULTISPECIES: branched-chain amino acid ABC transporter permease [Pseudanabaena]MEA5487725.1 branched-chain amino acid ABC transporter permease [Pseudanabaena sp. CCNP1317]WGS70806.1 branched-chain amino acid ABC transporter permease [Pseudanabaena galeata CCNP1313]